MHKCSLKPVHSFTNLQPDVSYEGIRSRIRLNVPKSMGLFFFEGLHIASLDDIQAIREAIEDTMKENEIAEKSIRLFVNYDDFTLEDTLLEAYGEMVKHVSQYYREVTRYTTRSFKQRKLKHLSRMLKTKVSGEIEEVALFPLGNILVKLKTLGEGSFGVVHLCQLQEGSGQLVALKVLKKAQLGAMGVLEFVHREIQILSRVNHKNIVKMLFHEETDSEIFIAFEYVEHSRLGLLSQWDDHEKIDDEHRAKKIFWQLAQALHYLHSEPIRVVHRDLQLDNVCLTEDDQVVLIDFGCADYFDSSKPIHDLLCGIALYVPPEVLQQQLYYGPEVDVWGFGVLLYRVLTGYMPFTSAQKILLCKWNLPLEDETFSEEAKDLIRKVLVPNVKHRYTLAQIMAHPWFRGVSSANGHPQQ